MSPGIRIVLAAAALALAGLVAPGASAAPNERNPIYAVGGNDFIVRVRREGGTLYLRAYRRAGYLWERFGATSIPVNAVAARRAAVRRGGGSMIERIYFSGRVVGHSDVDLDNLHNLLLNDRGLNCFNCD